MASIALSVDELRGTTIGELFSPGSFSWLAVPFLAAPLVRIVARRRTGGIRARLGPAPALLAWLSAGLIAGTLLFSRNKIVLAPLAAVVIGGLFEALAPTGPAGGEARPRLRRPRSRDRGAGAGSVARNAGRVLVVACILATAKDAVSLALTRESRLDPGERSALEFLARATPPEAVVLAPWDRGYQIQAYAGRKTVVDGLLEDPLNQRRIIGIAGAWLAPRTDSLAAWCERTGANYLLVPPSSALYGIAVLTDWPAAWKTRVGVPLTREDADRVLV